MRELWPFFIPALVMPVVFVLLEFDARRNRRNGK